MSKGFERPVPFAFAETNISKLGGLNLVFVLITFYQRLRCPYSLSMLLAALNQANLVEPQEMISLRWISRTLAQNCWKSFSNVCLPYSEIRFYTSILLSLLIVEAIRVEQL